GTDGPSPRLAALFHAVPPGAHAGHEIVIARDHLDRLALAILGGLDAELARFLLLFRRHPAPLVTPQARAEFALERLPGCVVDELAAPAVFDQKARRVPGIERGDVIAGMATERDADALGVAEREIVALSHIVETVELHHHVMDHVDAALDEGDAVMARIDVEEIGRKRAQPVVADLELEDVLIERHHLGDALEMHHHVAMPSGPVRRPEMLRPGLNGSGVVSAPWKISSRLPAGSLSTIKSSTWRSPASAREPRATLVPAASMRAATASSAAASATSQPKKAMPCPPSASPTSRCLRSSMREARPERRLSMRCRPRKFSP